MSVFRFCIAISARTVWRNNMQNTIAFIIINSTQFSDGKMYFFFVRFQVRINVLWHLVVGYLIVFSIKHAILFASGCDVFMHIKSLVVSLESPRLPWKETYFKNHIIENSIQFRSFSKLTNIYYLFFCEFLFFFCSFPRGESEIRWIFPKTLALIAYQMDLLCLLQLLHFKNSQNVCHSLWDYYNNALTILGIIHTHELLRRAKKVCVDVNKGGKKSHLVLFVYRIYEKRCHTSSCITKAIHIRIEIHNHVHRWRAPDKKCTFWARNCIRIRKKHTSTQPVLDKRQQ